jgi:SAM-dependent methyltransferase
MQLHHNHRGYQSTEKFMGLYRRKEGPSHPSLKESLVQFSQFAGEESVLTALVQKLPQRVRCLIQGYTVSSNAKYLKHFLNCFDIRHPEIHAIDLHDMPARFQQMGIPVPDIQFLIADASDLSAEFPAGSFDIIVQDHLLNACPAVLHGNIISELARILTPDGFALFSYTGSDTFSPGEIHPIDDLLTNYNVAWNQLAYSLHDLEQGACHLTELEKKVLSVPGSDTLVFITPGAGNFEFFPAQLSLDKLIESNGLRITGQVCSEGTDAYGLHCLRRHYILTHP